VPPAQSIVKLRISACAAEVISVAAARAAPVSRALNFILFPHFHDLTIY
jgi:hypothetical protein